MLIAVRGTAQIEDVVTDLTALPVVRRLPELAPYHQTLFCLVFTLTAIHSSMHVSDLHEQSKWRTESLHEVLWALACKQCMPHSSATGLLRPAGHNMKALLHALPQHGFVDAAMTCFRVIRLLSRFFQQWHPK